LNTLNPSSTDVTADDYTASTRALLPIARHHVDDAINTSVYTSDGK